MDHLSAWSIIVADTVTVFFPLVGQIADYLTEFKHVLLRL